MKIYNFIGTPCFDVLIYLGEIFNALGKKVLIIDHSAEQEVMNCIAKPLDLKGRICNNQVDYVGEGVNAKDYLRDYDIVLCLLSFSAYTELHKEMDGLIIVTDNKRKNMEGAMNVIINTNWREVKLWDANGFIKQLVIRDICDKRFGKEYFRKEDFQRQGSGGLIEELKVHEIGFDEQDYSYRIQLEHEAFQRFSSLSGELREVLFQWAAEFSQMSIKKVKETFKKGKRGNLI